MIGRALAVGKRAILSLPCGLGVLALPLLVEVRVEGPRPHGPCVLAVTHSGGPDPLYVARAVGSWRTPALFSIDPRYPFLRPFYRALWRFEIREGEKEFNRRTLRAAVEHLQKGGQIMVFADGPDFRRGTLKPGAAVLAPASSANRPALVMWSAWAWVSSIHAIARSCSRAVARTRSAERVEAFPLRWS